MLQQFGKGMLEQAYCHFLRVQDSNGKSEPHSATICLHILPGFLKSRPQPQVAECSLAMVSVLGNQE